MNEADKIFEEFLVGLIKAIGKLLKGGYWGVRKLNKKINIILFLLSFTISFITVFLKANIKMIDAPIYIRNLLYYILLLFPIIFLILLGSSHDRVQEKIKKQFKEIGFIGKDNKCPYLISSIKEGKKIIYKFKSNIPLQDWKKSKALLETGLNCNIILMQEGKDKKTSILTTVPSDCKIPEEVNWSNSYVDPNESVLAVGEGALEPIKIDLNRTPHIIVAGETGSGKSVTIRTIIKQASLKNYKIHMVDFKGGVEFGIDYEQLGEVITSHERVLTLLTELVEENTRRLELFRAARAKNLGKYNQKTGENLKRYLLVIDELAEMLDKKGLSKAKKELYEQIEGKLSTLARLSRASGINVVFGVQRPDANILPGQIKNNIPVRICGRFVDKPASDIVLGNTMACDLPDIKGRFLYRLGNEIVEFQAYYFDDDTMLFDNEIESNSKEKMNKNSSKLQLREKKKKEEKKKEEKKKEEKKKEEIENNDFTDQNIVFDEEISWSVEEKEMELDFNYKDE